jgi:phosphoglycolate phosphatase-like HAD superfamily hydrolase
MWEELRERHGLHPAHTAMIGDKYDDVRFGLAAGLRVVLVLTGQGREHASRLGLTLPDAGFRTPGTAPSPDLPHALAVDLVAAAEYLNQAF